MTEPQFVYEPEEYGVRVTRHQLLKRTDKTVVLRTPARWTAHGYVERRKLAASVCDTPEEAMEQIRQRLVRRLESLEAERGKIEKQMKQLGKLTPEKIISDHECELEEALKTVGKALLLDDDV